ncbi:MAG: alpha/beta hydrolase [Bacteroidia bacterium]|nr:alpha/beta hydrolase [Bacteroidia bacterium]
MAISQFPRCTVIFLLLALLPLTSIAQSGKRPFENSHFDTIEGFSVHYRIWNENFEHPAGKVFFVHGFAGSTFCFRNLYDTLASLGYQVVAVDIPGAGYSSRSLDFNQSHSHRAKFLWKLLNRIDWAGNNGGAGDGGDGSDGSDGSDGNGNWILVGHSMGGGAAEAMAILHPERTNGLLLIAGTIFRKTNNLNSNATFMMRQKQVKKYMVSYANRNLITYKRFYKLLKSAYGRLPDSTEVLGYLTPLEAEGSAEALINIYVNNREKESLDARTLTDVPVRAIWGTKDNWVSLRTSRINFGVFPQFELVKIKGAGHMPMETHVQQFIPPFLEFLRQ